METNKSVKILEYVEKILLSLLNRLSTNYAFTMKLLKY